MMDWLELGLNQQAFGLTADGNGCEIRPSILPGYYYITKIEAATSTSVGFNKPLLYTYIDEVLSFLEIDSPTVRWSLTPCQPLSSAPFQDHPTETTSASLVYFIEGAGLIKIGVAEDPEGRMRNLQRLAPVPLCLLATCEGGYKRERELHARFAQDRRQGEWFEPSRELQEVIAQCKVS